MPQHPAAKWALRVSVAVWAVTFAAIYPHEGPVVAFIFASILAVPFLFVTVFLYALDRKSYLFAYTDGMERRRERMVKKRSDEMRRPHT